MMRERRFIGTVEVTHQLVVQADPAMLDAEVKARLDEQLSEPLIGPRGGRYEPFGDITYLGGVRGDDRIRNTWTYAARRMGKYVRPGREAVTHG